MKKIILTLLVVSAICSCSKDKPQEDLYKYYDGKVTLTRNGANKTFRMAAVYDTVGHKRKVNLFIRDIVEGYEIEMIKISNVPSVTGTFLMIPTRTWQRSQNPTRNKWSMLTA